MDFDVTIGQCGVSDKNLLSAILIRHKTLSGGAVKKSVSHFNPTCYSLTQNVYRTVNLTIRFA